MPFSSRILRADGLAAATAGAAAAGSDGGNAGGVIPSGGLYGVYSVSPDLKLGASVNSYIGGNLDYANDWVGRYYTQKAEILTFRERADPAPGFKLPNRYAIARVLLDRWLSPA